MSRYLLLSLLLIFTACATKTVEIKNKSPKVEYKSVETLMVDALFYEHHKEPRKAMQTYIKLYKRTNDGLFLKEALVLKINFSLKENELVALLKSRPKNKNLARLEVLFYIQNKQYDLAKTKLEALLKYDKDYQNYELLGDLYLEKKSPFEALTNYEKAYKYSKNKGLTLKYASLLIELKYLKRAKIILLNYERHNKPDMGINLLLSKIYKIEKDEKRLVNVYEKLYKLSNNLSFIYVAIDLLSENKQYKYALKLALKYKLDVNTLLFLYYVNKDLKNAINLALKEYKATKNKNFLLRAAVFNYELNPKNTKEVISLFEEGIDKNTDSIYLNYYGYLLIENDIDVQKGIKLIKRALEIDPKNVFYIDSLAWGYYKLNECKKAKELLPKMLEDKEFVLTKEARYHIKKIRGCKVNEK